ncbi:MAG: hypothetical protein JWQ35_2048 [Bacteriovoracaceae bacterium]|nr:hypothetical protein [Bacteriovoracaceae bacterium]
MKNNKILNFSQSALVGFLFLAIFFLSSCASSGGSNVQNASNSDYTASNTVSVISTTPADLATNISVSNPIVVTFSSPIQTSGVQDGINVRVTNDSGGWVPGLITFNATGDQLSWVPSQNSLPVSLDISSHYRVLVQFMTDPLSHTIAPWYFDFNTVKFLNSTGKFHIIYFGKQRQDNGAPLDNSGSSILFSNQAIEAQFSEPVYPNSSVCSTTAWSDSFQVIVGTLGNISGTSGTSCIICRAVFGGSVCDTLRFTPNKAWVNIAASGSLFGAGINATIKKSTGLKGISGEPMQSDQTVTLYGFP